MRLRPDGLRLRGRGRSRRLLRVTQADREVRLHDPQALYRNWEGEEEATFLATQQVDEARHMQFYARFRDEVIADPQAIGTHVAAARQSLSPAFATLFDEALVRAHERLLAAPADAGAKVDFVTTY